MDQTNQILPILPIELLDIIVSYSHHKSRANLSEVNKHFYSLTQMLVQKINNIYDAKLAAKEDIFSLLRNWPRVKFFTKDNAILAGISGDMRLISKYSNISRLINFIFWGACNAGLI